MTFMIKKKRYKFVVDLVIDELTEVSYSKGIMFAKIRQLDGGSFSDVSKRVEVQNHSVKYNDRFIFPCKMLASSSSVILETCKCRISIRMEEKGGKHFRKIGFADVNMAEYAGAGASTQKYILQAYDSSHRLDNSMLQITLNITLKEGDTIFQRPLNRSTPYNIPPGEEEEPQPSSSSSPPSSKSSLTVPTSSSDLVKLTNSPSLSTVPSSVTSGTIMSTSVGCIGIELPLEDNNHTRNSSTTSHTSAGYISSSCNAVQSSQSVTNPSQTQQTTQQGHSRQSSSGDSCHGSIMKSNVPRVQSFIELFLAKRGTFMALSQKTHSFPGAGPSSSLSVTSRLMSSKHCIRHSLPPPRSIPIPPSSSREPLTSNFPESLSYPLKCRGSDPLRNLSQGSSDTGFYGSMEKEKSRRKKLDEGRVDPELVIKELMEGVDLDKVGQDEAETSGLQLFVGKDGTFTFDKSSSRKKDYEPVVMF